MKDIHGVSLIPGSNEELLPDFSGFPLYCLPVGNDPGWERRCALALAPYGGAVLCGERNTGIHDSGRKTAVPGRMGRPTGFCLLEKRFVDVALRYGLHPATLDRWRAVLAIQKQFETKMGCSIYAVLPGAAENSLGIIPGNTERISK